jgi:hypothetical protein
MLSHLVGCIDSVDNLSFWRMEWLTATPSWRDVVMTHVKRPSGWALQCLRGLFFFSAFARFPKQRTGHRETNQKAYYRIRPALTLPVTYHSGPGYKRSRAQFAVD